MLWKTRHRWLRVRLTSWLPQVYTTIKLQVLNILGQQMLHFSLDSYFLIKKETEFESEFSSGMYLLQESATWCKIGHFGLRHPKQKSEAGRFEVTSFWRLSYSFALQHNRFFYHVAGCWKKRTDFCSVWTQSSGTAAMETGIGVSDVQLETADLWIPGLDGQEYSHEQWLTRLASTLIESGSVKDEILLVLSPMCNTKVIRFSCHWFSKVYKC